MRRLRRVELPRSVLGALSSYRTTLAALLMQERKRAKPDVARVVEAAWRTRRRGNAMKVVEMALRAMASGIERCMYCEDSLGCDIEHFRPKVPWPNGTFVWRNLLLICAVCNRQKSSGFNPAILDPTRDDPSDHLVLSLSTGRLVPRDGSGRGAATLRVMKRLSSDQALTRGRLNAVTKLRTLLLRYGVLSAQGAHLAADEIRRTVVEEPFSAVFASVLRASKDPGARDVLGDELVDVT